MHPNYRRYSQVVYGDRFECSRYLFLFEGASSNLAGVAFLVFFGSFFFLPLGSWE